MPTQTSYNPSGQAQRKITSRELGLSSWGVIDRIPNLQPDERARLERFVAQAEQEKTTAGRISGVAKQQFKDYYRELLRGANRYVPPPNVAPPAAQGAQPQTQATGQPPIAGVPPPAVTAPASTSIPQPTNPPVAAVPVAGSTMGLSGGKIDFEAELMKILGGNTDQNAKLEARQLSQITSDFNRPDFGDNEQKILDIATQRARQEAATRTEAGDTHLAGQNLTGGGAALRNYQAETDNLSKSILDSEISVRMAAAERGASRRQTAFVNAANFMEALNTKNVGLATQLVNLYKAQTEAGLNEKQLALQQKEVEEGIKLSRDKFTEDTRRALVNEGFTEAQIKASEGQMLWQRAFSERQQTADESLSNRNLDLQTRINDRQLSQEDKRIALTEIKDNRGFGLESAMQDFQERQFLFNSGLESTKIAEVTKMNDFERSKFLEEMGFERDKFDATQSLSRDQFESYAKELERRYGLDINRFELEKALSEGELTWKILESQRRYDLDVESERQKWIASDKARELQEKLGMTELEIRQSLGEGELDIAREQAILEKWMFQEGINFEKYKFAEQLKAAKKKKKSSFLGGLVKTLVGGAVGFFTGGGPVGALAGALSANGVDIGGGSSSGSTEPFVPMERTTLNLGGT